jgi:predicted HD phosphohydrolase
VTVLDELVRLLTHPEYALWRDPNPERSRVPAIGHALQCATRAERAGQGPHHVVMALVHDAARPLNEVWHGEVIAEIMRDRIDPDCYEALRHHGAFQADIIRGTDVTERWREERWYPTARALAGWDAASFDPRYETPPLEYFLPALRAVLA